MAVLRTAELAGLDPAETKVVTDGRPADPLVSLRDLLEREHEEFLQQYHQAVDATHGPAGYRRLRRLLHVWSLNAVAAGQPGYYEELTAARAGTAMTVPVTDPIPDWAELVAAARGRP